MKFRIELWRESSNSDNHQFCQYQQNDQLSLTSPPFIEDETIMTFDVRIPGPGLGQTQKSGGLNQFTGSPSYPLHFYLLNVRNQGNRILFLTRKQISRPFKIIFDESIEGNDSLKMFWSNCHTDLKILIWLLANMNSFEKITFKM